MGDVSKKGENMRSIITRNVFTRWFLTKLCLYIVVHLTLTSTVTMAVCVTSKNVRLQRIKYKTETEIIQTQLVSITA